jgi:7-cyano-7-deazaguanine synthase
MKVKPHAVVLISGGMDSAVTAAIARSAGPFAALHASYGQRAERRELHSFHALAERFGAVDRLAVRLDYFAQIGGSSLTDRSMEVHEANLASKVVPNTYVPFRNAHFLAIAVSWAEVLGAEAVYIGAVSEDSSGYPDCRPEYYEAMNAAVRAGTRPETHIAIKTPLIDLAKRDIIRRGFQLGVPFELTWSCYRESETACGACDSCALRLRAFREAGLDDPIPYAVRPEYLRP